MWVEDFEGGLDITTPQGLEAALSRRYGDGRNSFWLAHEAGKFPAINIMVRGELAYVHYFPMERHAGFASVAKVPSLRPDETSIFFLYPTEKVWAPNEALIPFSEALKAAQEFAISNTMPKCIAWFKL
jgi:hypothetical protein